MSFAELLNSAPENLAIVDALGKCHYQVKTHQKIMCSVSGGSDSDVMMDHKAMLKVFGPSYEYRRQFEAFREEMRKKERDAQ